MKVRFTSTRHPIHKDCDRVDEMPNDPDSGLSAHMFILSKSEPGATIVMTMGEYVRTWTLVEW